MKPSKRSKDKAKQTASGANQPGGGSAWQLNKEQMAAATFGDDPLLIIAGAGTGKTTTLVHRVAHQLMQGVPPQQIMLLTFTRRAAAQMIQRLRQLCVASADSDEADQRALAVSNIWAGTFHAISIRLLALYADAAGLPSRITVHDRSDAQDLMDTLLSRLKQESQVKGLPKKATALNIYSFWLNSQWPLERVLGEQFPDYQVYQSLLKKLFLQYAKHQQEMVIADYDGLLVRMRDLLRDQQAGPQIRQRFQRVLVDEYQDTNPLQAQILQELCPTGKGLTVVGDDAQSIYSFRAATVRNILDFPQQFPGAQVLKLQQNYRSTPILLSASNAVIAEASEKFDKELWSARESHEPPYLVECESSIEEAELIVDGIIKHREAGVPLEKQAVLFRASHHSLALETELAANNIPFVKYGGLRFAESAHVKDILAFLRVVENVQDTIAAQRVLLLVPGVGPKRAGDSLRMLSVSSSGVEVLAQARPPANSKAIWKQLVDLLCRLQAHPEWPLSRQLSAALEFYAPLMEDRYEDARNRMQDLEQLISTADRFENRQDLLVSLTIDPPATAAEMARQHTQEQDRTEQAKGKSKQEEEKPLVLSTIHSAKGLEWPVVFVMNVSSGMLPMSKAAATPEGYEEERRLLYVALTRAADWLCVSYQLPDESRGWRNSYWSPSGGRSEFLSRSVLKQFEQV